MDTVSDCFKCHFRPTAIQLSCMLILLVLGGLKPALLRAEELNLIPEPREVVTKAHPFQVTPEVEIVLPSATAATDRTAAASLEKELELTAHYRLPILASQSALKTPAIYLGRLDQPFIRDLLTRRHVDSQGIGEQGYVLDVSPEGVVVAGRDSAGLFYGVQTLRQLVVGDQGGAKILGARVRDWPALRYRGTQVDMSRGPVPKLSYLKYIVDTISQFKMNQLYMYMEDSFRLKGQPLVGLLTDTLSHKDWKELVAYAARRHVQIIPSTEDCGHLHKVLRFEQYSGLAERPHGYVLAPGDPKGIDFLKSMYEQMLPIFSAPFYHIGCDETFDLGKGRSAAKLAQEGYGRLYVDEVTPVYNLVRGFNKQVIFWGDIAVEHPEMIPYLPKGLIVASWEYYAYPNYDKWLKPFQKAGMKILVCPWVGNTSQIIPDYEEAAANIGTFLNDGKKAGAIGTDVTVWNDDGESLYGPNWWSIVYGAACAWEHGKTDVNAFDQKFDWAFYRNADHRFVRAIRELGHLNEVMRAKKLPAPYISGFGGTGDGLFWQDPFSAAGQKQVQSFLPVAAHVRRVAENAYTVLVDGQNRAKRNAGTLADFRFAALKLDALGMRYQFMKEISDYYADAVTHQHDRDHGTTNDDLSQIQSTNGRLEDLRDYTTRLTELYKQLWLSENLPHWLPNILQLYQRNSQLWQAEIAKFAAIRHERPLPSAESLGLLTVTEQK